MDDPVAVALEIVTRSADSPAILQTIIIASASMGAAFIMAATPAFLRIAGIARHLCHQFSLFTSVPSLLTQANPSPPTLRNPDSNFLAACISSNGPTTMRFV